jgi:hypothetical protein
LQYDIAATLVRVLRLFETRMCGHGLFSVGFSSSIALVVGQHSTTTLDEELYVDDCRLSTTMAAHGNQAEEEETTARAANRERQRDEIRVMQAVFPDQVSTVTGLDELDHLDDMLEESQRAAVADQDLPATFRAGDLTFAVTLCLPTTQGTADTADVTVQFTFPRDYPEDCVCAVRMRSPAISPTNTDALHVQLTSYLAQECFVGSECALLALNYVEEHAVAYFTPSTKAPAASVDVVVVVDNSPSLSSSSPTTPTTPVVVRRSWVRFHHLLRGKAHAKERALTAAAKSYGLGGFIVYGTPGLVWAQGTADDVTAFLAACRGSKIGKKPEVVTTDEIPSTTTDTGGRAGLVELPMSHFEALLVEQGLGDRRREILGLV